MTFKLSAELTFPWPVKVIEPDPNNAGKKIEHEFTAIFAFLDPDEEKASATARLEILKRASNPDLKAKELRAIQNELEAHDRDALLRVLRGWSDFEDAETREPFPFTPEVFAAVYRHPRVRNAFLRGYKEAITEDGGRLGN